MVTIVTEQEVTVLVSFLTGGLLVGVVGRWLDVVTAFVKGR